MKRFHKPKLIFAFVAVALLAGAIIRPLLGASMTPARADSGKFNAVITNDCSSPQTIVTVHTGDIIFGEAVLLSTDPNESGEGEPLVLSGPGLSFTLPNYSQHQAFNITPPNDGVITGCIPGADGDESGNVTIAVNQGNNPTLLTADQKNALSNGGNVGYEAGAVFAVGGAVIGLVCPLCGVIFVAGGVVIGYGGYKLDKLANDPPDPNYMVIATPVTPRLAIQPVIAGQGLTQQEADAFNALLDNEESAIGLETAMLTSINRASGAQNAGDSFWESQQEQAARQYAGQAAKLISAEPGLLKNLQSALQAANIQATITSNDVYNFESNIAANGLPSTWKDALTQLGADNQEQNDIQQAMIVQNINVVAGLGGGTFPQMLTDPTIISPLQQAAQALNQFAQHATVLSIVSSNTLPTGSVLVKAKLTEEDGTTPVAGRNVSFAAGGTTGSGTTGADGVATATLPLAAGKYTLSTSFAGDTSFLPSSATAQTLYVYQPSQFVIWGGNPPIPSGQLANIKIGQDYVYWSDQWAQQILGGSFQANPSFKGYAKSVSGTTWTSDPGNSSGPPAKVSSYISVIVTTQATKNGNIESGNVAEIVVLQVDNPSTYQPDPGHPGSGVVVALVH